MSTTTIRLHESTKKRLDRLKVHPRETYEEVVERLIQESEQRGKQDSIRQKAVQEFVRRAKAKHGERIQRILAYGSYARGESTEESDVDLIVVWNGERADGWRHLGSIANDIFLELDTLLSLKVYTPEDYHRARQLGLPFIINVEREGIRVG